MNIIKDFLNYRRAVKHYQMIDELEQADKVKLDAFDKDVLTKIYNKALERLSADMLEGHISADYVKWAKTSLFFFKEQFRKYKIKDFK